VFGGYEFDGKMKDWMDIFQEWYKQDAPLSGIEFTDYFFHISSWYLFAIIDLWQSQDRVDDVKELKAIELVVRQNPSRGLVAMYDAVDYMADKIPLTQMQALGEEAREFARKQMGL
jgi:hypothetical protein